jgi:hypothetical protein
VDFRRWGLAVDEVNEPKKNQALMGGLRAVALMFTITASVKAIAWPWVQREFFSGPAIEIKTVTIDPYDDGSGRMLLLLDKLRPCDPKTATLDIVDSQGFTFAAHVSWEETLPVEANLRVSYRWVLPDGVDHGLVKSAKLTVWHWHCADGPDPKQPFVFKLEPFEIRKPGSNLVVEVTK